MILQSTSSRQSSEGVCGAARFAQWVLCLLAVSSSWAQELEPRAFSPNPVGAHFLVAGTGYSSGNVLIDASLPLEDVEARLNNASLGYGQALDVLGRSAIILVAVPYVWGDVSGMVGEEQESISRSGLADTRLKFSINLLGGPALALSEFVRTKPRTSIGASLAVVAPTGQYDPAKLINIGSNRWSFKPELGISHPVGNWFLEASAGVWLFTTNNDFYGGVQREQDPVATYQAHVSYTFRPQLWLAADATYYEGGQSTVGGVLKADLQENTRVGLTLAVPVHKGHAVKLTWSRGASTRIGGDFTSYGLAWQYTWFN